jgi:hypothetical protein
MIDKVTGSIHPVIDREYIEGESAREIEGVNRERQIRDKARRPLRRTG